MLDPSIVAAGGFVVLFSLMLLRFPIGLAMGFVGVCGFGLLVGWGPALKLLAQSPIRTATDVGFAVIPMFLLMGTIASASGMSGELFHADGGGQASGATANDDDVIFHRFAGAELGQNVLWGHGGSR